MRWICSLVVVMFLATLALAEEKPADAAPAKAVGDPYPLTTDALTGAPLGDKPVIYVHEGRELRFANDANVEAFKKDPAPALKKVDEQIIDQQSKTYPLDTCPISKDKLGGDMGEPVKLVYRNRLIEVCCSGCTKKALQTGAEILPKLDAAVIEKQKATYPLKTCVVSGDDLGETPVDYVIGTRLVRFCCADCVNDFKKDPTKFLGKLDAAAKK